MMEIAARCAIQSVIVYHSFPEPWNFVQFKPLCCRNFMQKIHALEVKVHALYFDNTQKPSFLAHFGPLLV